MYPDISTSPESGSWWDRMTPSWERPAVAITPNSKCECGRAVSTMLPFPLSSWQVPEIHAAQTPATYLQQLSCSRSLTVRVWFGVGRRVGLPFLKPQHHPFLKGEWDYLEADSSWTFQKTDFYANPNARKTWINGIQFWIKSWPSPLSSFVSVWNQKEPVCPPPCFPFTPTTKWFSLNSVHSQKRVTWVKRKNFL